MNTTDIICAGTARSLTMLTLSFAGLIALTACGGGGSDDPDARATTLHVSSALGVVDTDNTSDEEFSEWATSEDVPDSEHSALPLFVSEALVAEADPTDEGDGRQTATRVTRAVGDIPAPTTTPKEVPGGVSHTWSSNLEAGLTDWPGLPIGWGSYNRTFSTDPEVVGHTLRVFLPEGSIDPANMKRRGLPYGGTGFKSKISTGAGYDLARLSYKVRFPVDFEQGRGGKLPGLCGGKCNGGGVLPNGTDGFSTRYMWTGNFAASVYAYLPTSVKYGTPIGSRKIPLQRAKWVQLEQEVKLNTVGRKDGYVKVWADGKLVVNEQNLVFRTVASLKIDQLFFDVFYGGSDDSWAAPKNTVIEFAEFSVTGR